MLSTGTTSSHRAKWNVWQLCDGTLPSSDLYRYIWSRVINMHINKFVSIFYERSVLDLILNNSIWAFTIYALLTVVEIRASLVPFSRMACWTHTSCKASAITMEMIRWSSIFQVPISSYPITSIDLFSRDSRTWIGSRFIVGQQPWHQHSL